MISPWFISHRLISTIVYVTTVIEKRLFQLYLYSFTINIFWYIWLYHWICFHRPRDHRSRDRMVVWFQLYMQSLPITDKVVSSDPAHGEVYSIQHYVINCQLFAGCRWFSPVSSTNKADRLDITEILLKVALSTH